MNMPTWVVWSVRIGIVAGSLWLLSNFVPGAVKPLMILLVLGTLFVYMRRNGGLPWLITKAG